MMFFIFKIFKKIEGFLSWRGLRRIPGVDILYKKLWLPLGDFFYDRAKPKGTVLINVQGNKMYVNTNDRDNAPTLLTEGGIEKYQTELFKKMVRESMIVVDIGASIGYYALIAANLVGKSGIIYAFEPEPNNYRLLCKNIEVNKYTNIVPIQKAVSNKNGKIKLWFEKELLTTPSFSKENVLVKSRHKTLGEKNFVDVRTTTLDNFFENVIKNNKVDIIKIDAEGAEGLVMEGAEKILRSNNNLKIFTEFWPEGLRNLATDPLELLQKLQGYGFKIKRVNEKKQILESMGLNQLYQKAKFLGGFNLLLEK